MNWMAKFLLIGGLAIAAVALLATAIAVASPYLALILIIWCIINFMGKTEDSETEQTPR